MAGRTRGGGGIFSAARTRRASGESVLVCQTVCWSKVGSTARSRRTVLRTWSKGCFTSSSTTRSSR